MAKFGIRVFLQKIVGWQDNRYEKYIADKETEVVDEPIAKETGPDYDESPAPVVELMPDVKFEHGVEEVDDEAEKGGLVALGGENGKTMSSRDIAELTGKMHKHVMRDIRNIENDLEYGPNLDPTKNLWHLGTYKASNGKLNDEYQLTKIGALLLASGYNVTLRLKIILRWEELERRAQETGGIMVSQEWVEENRDNMIITKDRHDEYVEMTEGWMHIYQKNCYSPNFQKQKNKSYRAMVTSFVDQECAIQLDNKYSNYEPELREVESAWNFQGWNIRVWKDQQENAWFYGKEVADILGYTNTKNAISYHCKNKSGVELFSLRSGGKCGT